MRRSCQRWSASVACALAATFAACAADSDTHLDVTFDPCNALVTLDEAATAEQSASLDAALALWNERGGLRLRRAAPSTTEDPLLAVRFETLGAFRGYYDDEVGEVLIHRGLRGDTRTIVIAHELGHAFGLLHVKPSARKSVMNPGNTRTAPTSSDASAVRALWGDCE
jgi:hypothetical protein